jgi:hypothetical protein
MTDTFNRRKVGADGFQCGCRWTRDPAFGDVLVQCPIHRQASDALVRKFERERGAPPQTLPRGTDNG